jgi:citronellol/citronellal dehydrogenase
MGAGACEGRVALVTGASRGIGAAVAERLAAEGAAVALVARSLDSHPDHLPGTLAETAARIRGRGGTAVAIQADLSDSAARPALHERARAELGDVDILVNNAAASFYLPFERVSASRFRVAFELNVRTPWELAQLAVPAMKARGRGWILNLSSATARLAAGPPFDAWSRSGGDLLYGTTKAALERFTRGLAAELYEHGIAVNALLPVAAVLTPGVAALGVVPDGAPVEPVEAMAEAALALCTGDPRVLTGRIAESTPLLAELARPLRTLDGTALLEETAR